MLFTASLLVFNAIAPLPTCDLAPPGGAPRPRAPYVATASGRDSALVALYESGQPFEAFLAAANARRAMWDKHWSEGIVAEDVVSRARAIPGAWRLLIIAVDACSDSVNTVPYLARLSAIVPSIQLRIVAPSAGRAVQESHRTPDGRAATPTVVVLDEAGNDAGCWVERPKELQDAFVKARAEDKVQEWANGKQAWYDSDGGASTLREVVAVIAAAAAGTPVCMAPLTEPDETPPATMR